MASDLPPEFCLLSFEHWSTCMTKGEWSGWMQAVGSVLAVAVAIYVPWWQDKRSRHKERIGHLETIAMDVRLAGRQATIYLRSRFRVPAYRLPLHGMSLALPALLADGTLSGNDATALAQFYVDARSFNFCLDIAQGLKDRDGPWQGEVSRIIKKAIHLVPASPASRYDAAIAVLRKHLPAASLARLEINAPPEDDEDGEGSGGQSS